MYKGFYNLTSGMLTQSRVLNTISNNMTNASTPGYKKDVMTTSTFQDVLMYRTGNTDKSGTASLEGQSSMIRTVQELVTNYSQGAWDQTEQPLDFAVSGSGMFQVQSANGVAYTRNGSFTLDGEGYLYLPMGGRVMGQNGEIRLGTDKIVCDNIGNLFTEEGEFIDRLVIADFNDVSRLTKAGDGLFRADGQPDTLDAAADAGTTIEWKTLERSNVDAAEEMVAMMTSQRALQSAAQVLKMYDQLMVKANELGSIR